MVFLKSHSEIDKIRQAGRILAEVLARIEEEVAPGVSTLDLDTIAEEVISSHPGARAAFKGYGGFPNAVCTSVNEMVVHGIPSRECCLKQGDIIGVDVGVFLNGYYSDAARTYPVGEPSEEISRLLEVTREALDKGTDRARVNSHIGDIGSAVQEYVEQNGYNVVRDLVGHGIGQNLHEDPQVPNYGNPGRGLKITEGLVLAIEPMVNQGTAEVKTLGDNWTVVTADGKLSAHFENTVAVGPDGPEILTG
ncbi:MAG: type I methionyl aminopeptidase [Gemmatimonadota bacterium]|nr:type I methionyl aminopeptidase [Gemmatimonadota bacterium]